MKGQSSLIISIIKCRSMMEIEIVNLLTHNELGHVILPYLLLVNEKLAPVSFNILVIFRILYQFPNHSFIFLLFLRRYWRQIELLLLSSGTSAAPVPSISSSGRVGLVRFELSNLEIECLFLIHRKESWNPKITCL